MSRLMGHLLQASGCLCIAWGVLVWGSFSLVALKGFIGTGGNEAGGELLTFVLAMLVFAAAGLGLMKFGNRLL